MPVPPPCPLWEESFRKARRLTSKSFAGVRRKIESSIFISTVGLFCHGPACGHKGFGEALSRGPTSPPNVEPIPRSIWKIGRGAKSGPKTDGDAIADAVDFFVCLLPLGKSTKQK